MPAFVDIERLALEQKPLRTLIIPLSAFATAWKGRPDADVCVGLRPLSEGDTMFARGEAERVVLQVHKAPLDNDALVETYNDALMRFAVVRGTCDPNNATMPADCWKGGGETFIRDALTCEGVKVIYDAIESLTLETSPVRRMADDEEVASIAARAPAALALMPPARASRVRRLFAFLADEIGAYEG